MGARLAAAVLIAWAWPAAAQVPQGSVQADVRGGVALVEVVTRVGFETTIVLPPGWTVVERRLGDPDRWIVTGGGHLTMVRPLARGVATNLSLVLSDGSVLSIGLRESDLSPVYTVVHLSGLLPEEASHGEADGAAAVEDVVAGTGAEAPVFLSAADVEAIRQEEERALEALRSAEAEVRDRVEDAVAATDEAVEAFVAEYPTRLHFVFEFNPEVDVTRGAPLGGGDVARHAVDVHPLPPGARRRDRRRGLSPGWDGAGAAARGDRRRFRDPHRRGGRGRHSRGRGPGGRRAVADAEGGGALADWQLKVPSGVIPKNLPVYAGLGFAAVLIFVMFLTGSGTPPEDPPPGADGAAIEAAVADVRGVVAPVIRQGEQLREDLARLEAERESREEGRRQGEERQREESMRDARRELGDARSALLETQRIREEAERTGVPAAEVAGDIQATLETVEEREIREALRLDELQRFALSMRAPALVGGPGPPAAAQAAAPPPAITGDPAFDQQLLALLREEAGAARPAPPAPERRAGPAVVAPFPPGGGGGAPAEGAGTVSLTERYAAGPDIEVPESSGRGSAALVRWADVPEGLDLVYEGRMMQAVLETQLAGDFTGEARARITVPVRTRDRTRVVIPRARPRSARPSRSRTASRRGSRSASPGCCSPTGAR